MLNLEEKIRKRIAERGITMKFLATQIGVTEAGLSKMLKNNTMKVDTLSKISKVLDVEPTYWYVSEVASQSATGIGNAVGDSNKTKVHLGAKVPGRQEVYGRRIDDILMDLMKCEKERDVLKTKVTGLEGVLAAKDETIRALMGSQR